MKITVGWQGGAQDLFGNIRERTLDLKALDGEKKDPWTIRDLLRWIRKSSGYLTGNPDLFFTGEGVRNGIMVVINDADWELMGELDYQLEQGDQVVFISTLHGG